MSTQATGVSVAVDHRDEPGFRFAENSQVTAFAMQVEQAGLLRFSENTALTTFVMELEPISPTQIRRRRFIKNI